MIPRISFSVGSPDSAHALLGLWGTVGYDYQAGMFVGQVATGLGVIVQSCGRSACAVDQRERERASERASAREGEGD